MLAMLLLLTISPALAPPPLPMTIVGYVLIGGGTAPEGTHVYAKYVNQTQLSNTTTSTDGYYMLIIPPEGTPADKFPPEGIPLDLWVETINVTRITLQYNTILELNLTVPTLMPTVNFTATPTSGLEPLTVQFSDTSTNFVSITSWFWSFGDGKNSTQQNPTHVYSHDGSYTVSLTVVGDNMTLTETKPNYITVNDSTPNADFYGTPLFGAPPLTVQFYDLSTSYDGITSRLWNFGDNATSTEKNPNHPYTNEGIYTVSLKVTEADGDWDIEVKTNYVIVTTKIAGSINVMIDTGPIHFPGETAEFYIMALDSKGIPIDVNFTEHRLWFYANELHFIDLPKPTRIEGGVYRTYYQIPSNAPQVTYTLVVTAKQVTPEGTSYGGAIKSFQINPTLTGLNTWIKEIKDNIATIVIPGLTEIKANLTAINAKLINIQQTTATINSTLGLIQANVATINARLVSLNGTIAKISSDVGDIQLNINNINAQLISLNETIAKISSDVGDIQLNINNINAQLISLNNRVATINSTLGLIQTDVSNINAQLISLNETIAKISSDVGDIQTSVDAIHLKVVGIDWESKIANIQTTLGTIKGYVENVDDGGLATISTDLGTVKTNVSDLLQKGISVDLTPIWIAVVFSILAFIASIVTAYLLRSKIA
jgi:PKD repeat protein